MRPAWHYYLSPTAAAVRLQYECEDALGDAHLFDALGVGLGRAEMVNVALAVKKLGEDPQKAVDTVGCLLLQLSFRPAQLLRLSYAQCGCGPREAVQLCWRGSLWLTAAAAAE